LNFPFDSFFKLNESLGSVRLQPLQFLVSETGQRHPRQSSERWSFSFWHIGHIETFIIDYTTGVYTSPAYRVNINQPAGLNSDRLVFCLVPLFTFWNNTILFKEIFGRRVSVGFGNHIGVLQPEAIRLGTEEADGAIGLYEAEGSIGVGIITSCKEGDDSFSWGESSVIGLGFDGESAVAVGSWVTDGQLPVMGFKAEGLGVHQSFSCW
jgi:hypothetical protein